MKSGKFKLMMGTLLVVMAGVLFTGCGNSESSNEAGAVTISISGSTSVGPLMEAVAEKYESENSNVSIEIQQIGSSAGVKDTINGINEIGMASRELKDEEKAEVLGTIICFDGIALIVNKANTVKDITMEQIKDIYTGKITNWSELGGGDSEIVVISREEGSGTRGAFEELIGYTPEELVQSAQISDGNGNVKTTVEGNENAIGFVSFEYLDDAIISLTLEGVEPNAANVKSGEYLISRPFNITTKEDTLTENGEMLIDYILSPDGQEIVAEKGLITLE